MKLLWLWTLNTRNNRKILRKHIAMHLQTDQHCVTQAPLASDCKCQWNVKSSYVFVNTFRKMFCWCFENFVMEGYLKPAQSLVQGEPGGHVSTSRVALLLARHHFLFLTDRIKGVEQRISLLFWRFWWTHQRKASSWVFVGLELRKTRPLTSERVWHIETIETMRTATRKHPPIKREEDIGQLL